MKCGGMTPCSFKFPKGSFCQVIMKAVVEMFGTFVLVQAICLAINQEAVQPAFVAGLALMVLVYTFGHISGGHFNPAVSTCQWIAGQIPFLTWLTFVFAQVTGGIIGGLIASRICVNGSFPVFSAEEHEEGLWVEFLFTFLLCTSVANTATTTYLGYEDNSFFGFAIGMVVSVGGFMSQTTNAFGSSSGAFNPAVVFGCNIGAKVFADRNLGVVIPSPAAKYWAAFLGFEFLAAILAGLFFLLTETTVVETGSKKKYSDGEDGTTDGTEDSGKDDYSGDAPPQPTSGYPASQPQPSGNYNAQPTGNYSNPQPASYRQPLSGNYGNQPQPRGYSEQQGYITGQTIEMQMQ